LSCCVANLEAFENAGPRSGTEPDSATPATTQSVLFVSGRPPKLQTTLGMICKDFAETNAPERRGFLGGMA
jgi:hypothetical protein